MPTNILVTPDLFYHRWNETDGELWLTLFAFVLAPQPDPSKPPDLTDFHAWAKAPHSQKDFTFSHPSAGLSCRVGDAQRVIPIGLPSDVDIWLQIHRDGTTDAPWVRVTRDRSCLTSPARLRNNLDDLFEAAQRPAPPADLRSFSSWFNETVNSKWLAGSDVDRDNLAQWLELRLESGKLVDWKAGQEITSPYTNGASAAHEPLPLFRPRQPWLEAFPPGSALETNLYWLAGQMIPIGRKPAATLNTISGIDIVLTPSDVPIGTTSPPADRELHRVHSPPLLVGTPPLPPYYAAIVDSYDAKLVGSLHSAADAAADSAVTDHPVAYVSPVFSGLAQDRTIKRNWVFAAAKARPADRPDGSPAEADVAPVAQGKTLGELAALEIRCTPAKTEPTVAATKITVQPSLFIAGNLRRYRRFPRIAAPGAAIPTVMVFEPEPGSAALIDLVRTRLGAPAIDALIASASVPGWKLSALASDPLPWDGEKPVYRVLATATSGGNVAGKWRTCEPAPVTLTLSCPLAIVLNAADWIMGEPTNARRWTWSPAAGVDAAGLPGDWTARLQAAGASSKWVDLPFNGFVADIDLPDTAAAFDGLFLDEYAFQLADSRGRLERYLRVETDFPGGDPGPCGATFTPIEDFEDHLVNFNTAVILNADGKAVDDKVRFAQSPRSDAAPPTTRNLHRSQVIPLVIDWAREPRDERPSIAGAPPEDFSKLDRARLQAFVGAQMLQDLGAEPFGIQLEHTLGAVLRAADGTGAALAMKRAAPFPMPVDSPTTAEGFETPQTNPPSASVPDIRFLTCSYVKTNGTMTLQFDPDVLDPARLAARHPTLNAADSYALALTAWRAAAELAAADTVELVIDLRLFDLGLIAGDTVDAAETLAAKGFGGSWAKVVAAPSRLVFPIPLDGAGGIRAWARGLFASSAAPGPFSATLGVDGKPSPIGEQAHVVRANLHIARTAATKPPANLRYLPVTRQPGLQAPSPSSMLGVWARLGFGPWPGRKGPMLSLATLGGDAFTTARDAWKASLSEETDSITPAKAQVARGDEQRAAAALIAELEGTDWFTPEGRPAGDRMSAQPILVPFGFAPCAPHPKLGNLSQAILQRVLASVRDVVDLAYEDWATGPTNWADRIGQITALATRTGDAWTGPLPTLIQQLVDQLFLPEPHSHDSATADGVAKLAKAYRDRSGQIAHLDKAAKRLLLADPALFADAKAFLLTKIAFSTVSGSTGTSPPPESLSRARFRRTIRPVSIATTQTPAEVASVVGWTNLVAAGTDAGSTPAIKRFAFFESLDDARYDNAFHIERDAGSIESFEQMIEPHPDQPRPEWDALGPIVPSADESAQAPDAKREVRLASRAIVVPPELLWSGQDALLSKALDSVRVGDQWTAAAVHVASPGGGGPATALKVVAVRTLADRAVPANADQAIVTYVYRVRGDEEASGVDQDDAFSNDLFYLATDRHSDATRATRAQIAFDAIDPTIEGDLRRFLDVPRGSTDAAALAARVALKAGTYQTLASIAKPYGGVTLPASAAQLRVDPATGKVLVVDGAPGSDSNGRIRDAVLLRAATSATTGGPIEPAAYLLVSVVLDAWTGWDVQMTQGRNVPVSDGAGHVAATRQPAKFAPEFWQSAPQSTSPATSHLALVRGNATSNWTTPHYFLALDPNLVGKTLSVDALVNLLLFSNGVTIGGRDPEGGGGDPSKTAILSAASKGQIYKNRLSVTLHQEQCEGPNTQPRETRFPFATLGCTGQAEAAQTKGIMFPPEYRLMSVDFRWFRPSGAALFGLDRIFVHIP